MTQIILPIGLPGSGKSTWTSKIFPNHTPIRSDDIRQEIMGSVYDGSRNKEVWERFYKAVEDAWPENVIADATNLEYWARKRILDIGDDIGADVHAIVFINHDQAITRNIARKGRTQGDSPVPPDAMSVMIQRYEEMLRDIPSEPFDTITYVSSII